VADTFLIDAGTRDISPQAIGDDGCLRILPASFWAQTTRAERGRLAVEHGLYLLPSVELVDRLKAIIDGRRAIEIGAGNGILARALGIHATDNHMQNQPKYRALYESVGQQRVRYGRDVEELDAHDAIERYQPEVVVAAWVTHRYDPAFHEFGGNEIGVDEGAVIKRASYLFVGNEQVHAHKRIWNHPHTIEYYDWIYSRALNGSRDFIACWKQGK
jgi:hypothetical protein